MRLEHDPERPVEDPGAEQPAPQPLRFRPRSAEGVERWLTTRVPGIGPTFARAIVAHFGTAHVFGELDRNPERLREVRTKAGRAISRKSVERAIAAWRQVATIREVETFLFTHGISAGLAARLVRRYGDEVVDRKSTRLNSSHQIISYAVFCLKKKS